MKHLIRKSLLAGILVAFAVIAVMPAVADSANDRVSQWKKDRLSKEKVSQIGTHSSAATASDTGSTTWSREEGSRFARDGRLNDNERFPWAAPGLVPNGPNGTGSLETINDADGAPLEELESHDFHDDGNHEDHAHDGDHDDDHDTSPSVP